jgi:serine/threonine protein kinase
MALAAPSDPMILDESPLQKQAGTEPIPGYRLLEPLGTGGFGEVWKCEAPGGLLKAIKFVYGNTNALDVAAGAAQEELRAIQRVKAIRHPFLLSMERVENIGGELIIVLELADRSLHDLYVEYRAAGHAGIPREELLGYLHETAEALDLMNIEHELQHLDIKPRNLFLVSNHVKVGDFGLVNNLGRGAGPHLGAITPLYASPEVFQGGISRHSDQYSLAVVYQELLTGTLPFNGKNSRQLLLQHVQDEPNLEALPPCDRPALSRALAKDPKERFPSCADLVRALAAGTGSVVGVPAAAEPDVAAALRETANLASAKTATGAAGSAAPSEESVAGHRLLRCQVCTPLTEVWQALAPNGTECVVKVIYGFTPQKEGPDGSPSARLAALQHPVLVPIEVLHDAPGRLVLATEAVAKSLRDRLLESQAQKMPGIPRAELLGYLRTAAEGLHYLYEKHAVQHLGLNPRNLLLENDRQRISDFGLAQLIWLPGGQPVAKLNVRYSAPELLQQQVSPACDQYSLALIYHEMLTGALLRRGQAPGPGGADGLSLERLPVMDRDIVARALDRDPGRRWPTCVEFVKALEEAPARRAAEEQQTAWPSGPGRHHGSSGANHSAGNGVSAAYTAAGGSLETKFNASLPADTIRARLEGFRQKWHGEVVRADDQQLIFRMRTPRSFWQRWIGRRPGLEVQIRLTCPPEGSPAPADVAVKILPHDCGRKQSAGILQLIGPLLLESVRGYLQVTPRRRTQERLVWHHPLRARCIYPDGNLGEAIDCQGKDISLNGIGFFLRSELPTGQVRLDLPQTPQTPAMTVPARVVRIQGCGDGWFEVGAVLLPPPQSGGTPTVAGKPG